MASHSKDPDPRAENMGESKGKLKLSDCICPICMYIMIDPVTMPCRHELCMPCFKQNVQEASLTCPMCRTRISIWARKAGRNNKLVNETRWREIQEAFPERVKNRQNGVEEDYSSDEEWEVPALKQLAQPGEIRQEYEEQLKKLRAERCNKERQEAEASERLIQQLQKEEMRLVDERRHELEQLAAEDEAFAKDLAEQLNELESSLQQSPASTLNSLTKSATKSLPKTLLDKFVKRGARNVSDSNSPMGTNQARRSTEDKYPYTCISPWEKDDEKKSDSCKEDIFGTTNRTSNSSNGTVDYVYIDSRSSSRIDSGLLPRSKDEPGGTDLPLVGMTEEVHVHGTPIDVVGLDDVIVVEPDTVPTTPCEEGGDTHSKSSDEAAKSDGSRSESAGSTDSITQELVHFKPIQACPKTPPRRLPGGRVVEAPLIRSTPTNLIRGGPLSPSQAQCFSPDNPAGSPIMQKRLIALAAERQEQVRILSKGTSTDTEEDSVAMDHCYSSPTKRPGCDSLQSQASFFEVAETISAKRGVGDIGICKAVPQNLPVRSSGKVTIQQLLQMKKNTPATASSVTATSRKLSFEPEEPCVAKPASVLTDKMDQDNPLQLLPLESNLEEEVHHIVPDTLKHLHKEITGGSTLQEEIPNIPSSSHCEWPKSGSDQMIDNTSSAYLGLGDGPQVAHPGQPPGTSPLNLSMKKKRNNGDSAKKDPQGSIRQWLVNQSPNAASPSQRTTGRGTSPKWVSLLKPSDSAAGQAKHKGRGRLISDVPPLPSLQPRVLTTLLTPNTLVERQREVALKTYTEQTPRIIEKLMEKCSTSPSRPRSQKVEIREIQENESSSMSSTKYLKKDSYLLYEHNSTSGTQGYNVPSVPEGESGSNLGDDPSTIMKLNSSPAVTTRNTRTNCSTQPRLVGGHDFEQTRSVTHIQPHTDLNETRSCGSPKNDEQSAHKLSEIPSLLAINDPSVSKEMNSDPLELLCNTAIETSQRLSETVSLSEQVAKKPKACRSPRKSAHSNTVQKKENQKMDGVSVQSTGEEPLTPTNRKKGRKRKGTGGNTSSDDTPSKFTSEINSTDKIGTLGPSDLETDTASPAKRTKLDKKSQRFGNSPEKSAKPEEQMCPNLCKKGRKGKASHEAGLKEVSTAAYEVDVSVEEMNGICSGEVSSVKQDGVDSNLQDPKQLKEVASYDTEQTVMKSKLRKNGMPEKSKPPAKKSPGKKRRKKEAKIEMVTGDQKSDVHNTSPSKGLRSLKTVGDNAGVINFEQSSIQHTPAKRRRKVKGREWDIHPEEEVDDEIIFNVKCCVVATPTDYFTQESSPSSQIPSDNGISPMKPKKRGRPPLKRKQGAKTLCKSKDPGQEVETGTTGNVKLPKNNRKHQLKTDSHDETGGSPSKDNTSKNCSPRKKVCRKTRLKSQVQNDNLEVEGSPNKGEESASDTHEKGSPKLNNGSTKIITRKHGLVRGLNDALPESTAMAGSSTEEKNVRRKGKTDNDGARVMRLNPSPSKSRDQDQISNVELSVTENTPKKKERGKKSKLKSVKEEVCSDSSPEKEKPRIQRRKGRPFHMEELSSDLDSNRSPTNSSSENSKSPAKKKLHQLKRRGRSGRSATDRCVSMEMVDESSRDVLDVKSDGDDSLYDSPEGKKAKRHLKKPAGKCANLQQDFPSEDRDEFTGSKILITPKKRGRGKQNCHIEYTPDSTGKSKKLVVTKVVHDKIVGNVNKRDTRGRKQTVSQSQTMLQFVTVTRNKKMADDDRGHSHVKQLVFNRVPSSSPSLSSTSSVPKEETRGKGCHKVAREGIGKTGSELDPSPRSGSTSTLQSVASSFSKHELDKPDDPRKTRSDFRTDGQYRVYLEEQDRLMALQLQADFDMEAKLNLTAIRRKGSDGEYEFRGKKMDFSLYFSDNDIRMTRPAGHSKRKK